MTVAANRVFARAYEARREDGMRMTVYESGDGTKEMRVGGSPAWRNHNPGNLRPSRWNKGQIGTAWGFAVFADEDAGLRAMKDLLGRPLYAKLTLEAAIYKYAPPFDNNPSHTYAAFVSEKSEVGLAEVLGKIAPGRMERIVAAMVAFEKRVPGRIVRE